VASEPIAKANFLWTVVVVLEGDEKHVLDNVVNVQIVADARKRGYTNITAETCPQYLFLNNERMRAVGPYGKINPPIRNEAEQKLLWEMLKAGQVQTIGSDHAPHSKDAKEAAWHDIFAAPAGHPGLETTLPLMLTAVHDGQLTLGDVTRLCSENVATLYGLYPRKGVMQVGSDADIVMVDLHKRGRFDAFFMADHLAVLNMPVEALKRIAPRSVRDCRRSRTSPL